MVAENDKIVLARSQSRKIVLFLIFFNKGNVMCNKFIYLMSFVLVLALASNASADRFDWDAGDATLTIDNGATLSVDQWFTFANGPGETGTFNMYDGTLNAGSLTIGKESSTGLLNMTGGAGVGNFDYNNVTDTTTITAISLIGSRKDN